MSEAQKQEYELATDSLKNKIISDENLGTRVRLSALTLPGYLKQPFDEGADAERFRSVKWEILAKCNQPKRPQSLIITSSAQGEGKTTTTFNLGVIMSLEREWTSVMIDTSGQKNSLTSNLNLTNVPGLTDYLMGDVEFHEIVYPTDQDNCYMVPIGRHLKERAELLASSKMKEFIKLLKTNLPGTFAIFDTNNLEHFADARMLSKLVDQLLVIVQSGVTQKAKVQEMLQTLPKDKITGILVNQDMWA